MKNKQRCSWNPWNHCLSKSKNNWLIIENIVQAWSRHFASLIFWIEVHIFFFKKNYFSKLLITSIAILKLLKKLTSHHQGKVLCLWPLQMFYLYSTEIIIFLNEIRATIWPVLIIYWIKMSRKLCKLSQSICFVFFFTYACSNLHNSENIECFLCTILKYFHMRMTHKFFWDFALTCRKIPMMFTAIQDPLIDNMAMMNYINHNSKIFSLTTVFIILKYYFNQV